MRKVRNFLLAEHYQIFHPFLKISLLVLLGCQTEGKKKRLDVEYLHSSAKTGDHGDGVRCCLEERAAADDAVNVLLAVHILATGDVSEEEQDDEDDLAVRLHFLLFYIK